MLSTGRKACIILNNYELTEFFNLEQGNAQGDTISPFLFILGYQILLFKFEFSLQIAGLNLLNLNEAERGAPGRTGPVQVAEQVRAHKTYAMADDCTLLVRFEVDTLRFILMYLEDFEKISGLECNVEKTVLMQIGMKDRVPQEITDLGFDLKNEMTLLGAKIKNTGLCYDSNINEINEKIRKQVNFWTRFNLSLPGRINVAKTFLYSQVNYLGCFMPLPKDSLNGFSNLIENFVRGKLKIAKNRLYLEKKDGGLGLFEMGNFLGAQSCAWIKRADKGDSELWKIDLKNGSLGTIYNLRKENYNKKLNPILYHIVSAYEKFLFKFSAQNENFKKMFIFNNPLFCMEGNNRRQFDMNFFTPEIFAEHRNQISCLTFDSITGDNGSILNRNDFLLRTGIILSDSSYNKLRIMIEQCRAKYTKENPINKKGTSVQEFVAKIKKGSKRYRAVIEFYVSTQISANITKFAETVDTVIPLKNSQFLNAAWGLPFWDNSTKTFLFKLFNNQLGLNTRVANFVRGHERNCTFCTLNNVEEDNPETMTHLFFDCRFTENCLEEFFTFIFNQNRMITRSEFFSGFNTEHQGDNLMLNILCHLVKKFIWDCKLRFHIPNSDDQKRFFICEFSHYKKTNRLFANFLNKSPIFNNNRNFRF